MRHIKRYSFDEDLEDQLLELQYLEQLIAMDELAERLASRKSDKED